MFWHAFKVLRGALVFTAFYCSGAFYGLVLLPLVSLFIREPVAQMRRCQYLVSTAFRWTLDLLRFCRIVDFDSRRIDATLPKGPCLLIANHPSTIDVVAVLSVFREASVVVKRKIWDDRFLRYLFRYCGHIDGGDGSLEANIAVLEGVKERLAQGFPVVIFPEGGRSPAGGLATMHKGAFSIASTIGIDLIPLVIECDPPALHKDAPWHALPEQPVRYTVRMLPPVRGANSTARKLQREVTELYRRELGLLDTGAAAGATAAQP
ncbi:MAG: 1-acyl-sn-glycerol-3-phosphate acyltransferase [Polyangiaceae bacterium]|nr:1-acyl-sn-glycerol-3-phosphate acyltransferase [Polyangiaceae bacterium]